MFVLLIIFVAIIYGYRKMWIALVICLTTYLCLAWLISSGHVVPYRTAETFFMNRVVITSCFLVIIALMVWILGRSYRREIDVRQKVEESLRKSEENYRSIFESTGTSMILIEEDMTIIMVNAEFARNTGYSTDEIIGRMKWTELVHPDELERMIEQHRLRRETSGNALSGYELRYRTKMGDQRVALLNIQLLPETKKSVASLIDITERKKADEALRESEEQYRLLFESAGEGILLAQGDMIKFANPALAKILGYPRDIITTRPFSSFIHPDDIAVVVDRHTRRMRGETVETGYDFRILKSDGTQRLLHIISQQIYWDGMPASLSFVMDITEHRQAEEALRESEELFRSYLEFAPDGVYMSDLEGNFLYGNRKCEEIIGYRREELIGKNFLELNLMPENCLNKAIALLQANIAGKSTGPDEIELIIKEGRIKSVEISTNVIQRMGQRIILAFVRDITDRKQAEEEKRLLEERLRQTDKMDSIGTLAGGIAHDFNNLLAGIQGYAAMTLMNLKENDPNYERLQRINEQVQSGSDLTRQLLGFARGGRYEVKPSDINEILEKTSAMFGRTKKEISINQKSGKDLWCVEVDRGQIEQVFLNLYVNAWQAMPKGGDIYLETQNAILNGEQALFYSVKPGKHVRITITDTGTGMDENTKEKIFEPFFTTKEMGRGTGLGLATVYGIIKGHEGIIYVDSDPGHGTTFTIYLPASEKEVLREEEHLTEEIVMGTETILLIDDEIIVMEVNKELLESLGYNIYAAGSGQEGIDIYMEKKDKIDLVILDMIMPGISGGVTFDRLREINPNIKVLLSSGYSITGEAQEIMDRGCNGFLQKPFLLEELSSKVRELLG